MKEISLCCQLHNETRAKLSRSFRKFRALSLTFLEQKLFHSVFINWLDRRSLNRRPDRIGGIGATLADARNLAAGLKSRRPNSSKKWSRGVVPRISWLADGISRTCLSYLIDRFPTGHNDELSWCSAHASHIPAFMIFREPNYFIRTDSECRKLFHSIFN